MTPRESIILCEGFDDRAFWAGWLKYLHCHDLSDRGKKDVYDPWGKSVVKGHLGYQSLSGKFIRIMPCHNDGQVIHTARLMLERRMTHALDRLIVNLDADANLDNAIPTPSNIIGAITPAIKVGDDYQVDDVLISILVWQTADPHTEGVPDKQTLERLVCAAIGAAYPEYKSPVHNWLQAAPQAALSHKNYSWSYMAKWYADKGCAEFYTALWDDPLIAKQLQERLTHSGVWRIAEALAK